MASIEKSIEVGVPARTAYNQWTQFEEFPRFMEGVKSVRQLDERRLHWRAEIAGKEKEWDALITEQIPDQLIAWRSTTGAFNAGRVRFEVQEATRTRVTLHMEYVPESPLEAVGDALGLVSRRVEGDLKRFKEFVESRGAATGAWRGEIHAGQLEPTGAAAAPVSSTLDAGISGAATPAMEQPEPQERAPAHVVAEMRSDAAAQMEQPEPQERAVAQAGVEQPEQQESVTGGETMSSELSREREEAPDAERVESPEPQVRRGEILDATLTPVTQIQDPAEHAGDLPGGAVESQPGAGADDTAGTAASEFERYQIERTDLIKQLRAQGHERPAEEWSLLTGDHADQWEAQIADMRRHLQG